MEIFYQFNMTNVSKMINKYATVGGANMRSTAAYWNGYLYISSHSNNVYQVNATNVSIAIGMYHTNDWIEDGALVVNGIVFQGSDDGAMYALNATNVSLYITNFTVGTIANNRQIR